MNIEIRKYTFADAAETVKIWNTVVEDGIAFPQKDMLDETTGHDFFNGQDHTGLAVDKKTGVIVGLYILHPNNVGRCGHICNASYAVRSDLRGRHIGEALVRDSLEKAKALGYRIMQFNAVVKTNSPARDLYTRLGFKQLGAIPGGFLMKDGHFEDIVLYYYEIYK